MTTRRVGMQDVVVLLFNVFCPDCLDKPLFGECGSSDFGNTCLCNTGDCEGCGKTWKIPVSFDSRPARRRGGAIRKNK